jgi:hypothetical protein
MLLKAMIDKRHHLDAATTDHCILNSCGLRALALLLP